MQTLNQTKTKKRSSEMKKTKGKMTNEEAQELIDSGEATIPEESICNENGDVQVNDDGQMELSGIDTPLSKAAQSYLTAVEALNFSSEQLSEAKNEVLAQMDSIGKTTFVYEGKKFTKVEGAIKNPTLRISN